MKIFLIKNNIIFKKRCSTHRGFTLMEVMVSISIFAIIITIGIGSLLTIFKTLQQTRSDRQTIDSVSYIMDTLTRRIRTAQSIHISSNQIILTDQDGKEANYIVQASDSGEPDEYALVTIDENIDGGSSEYNLTPKDFIIKSMTFESVGSGQALVYVRLAGIAKNGSRETKIALQTAVSKRSFDAPN